MTPEEERLFRAAIANAPNTAPTEAPGVLNMSDPELLTRAGASTAGRRNRIAAQQSYADALRSKDMPQGRTVGPSGIYTGPNWGETLEGAVNKLTGGYMSGKLREDYSALDAAEADKALAGEQLANARTAQQQGVDAEQKGLDRALRYGIAGQSDVTQRRGQDMQAGTAAAGREAAADRDVELVSFWNPKYDPADKAGASQVLTYRLFGGKPVDDMGNPVDVTGMTPYEAESPGSMTTAQFEYFQKRQQNPLQGEGQVRPSVMSRIITSPDLGRATGIADPERWLGTFGYGSKGDEVQTVQRNMQEVVVENMASDMERVTLTPVSDRDMAMLTSKTPDKDSQPYAWLAFALNDYGALLEKNINQAVNNGVIAPEVGTQVIEQNYRDVFTGARQNDISPKRLEAMGFPPAKIREYLQKVQEGTF